MSPCIETSYSSDALKPDRKMLEQLICPLTRCPLEYDAEAQELISRSAKLAYPIRDGIPIMLPDEARVLPD
ncbi:Trm112 family protein [Hohaiivirga grylli]